MGKRTLLEASRGLVSEPFSKSKKRKKRSEKEQKNDVKNGLPVVPQEASEKGRLGLPPGGGPSSKMGPPRLSIVQNNNSGQYKRGCGL